MKLTRRKAIAGGMSAGLAVPLFAALRGGDAGCSAFTENSQWLDLSHIVVAAQGNWAEAFARWAVDPALEPVAPATTAANLGRQAIASGWLLIKAD